MAFQLEYFVSMLGISDTSIFLLSFPGAGVRLFVEFRWASVGPPRAKVLPSMLCLPRGQRLLKQDVVGESIFQHVTMMLSWIFMTTPFDGKLFLLHDTTTALLQPNISYVQI